MRWSEPGLAFGLCLGVLALLMSELPVAQLRSSLQKFIRMIFAIKAEVIDPRSKTFAFGAQKTMYGGKHIAKADTIFIFASENEGGPGLVASGVVISAKAIAKKPGIARQTPRVSITVRGIALAK